MGHGCRQAIPEEVKAVLTMSSEIGHTQATGLFAVGLGLNRAEAFQLPHFSTVEIFQPGPPSIYV